MVGRLPLAALAWLLAGAAPPKAIEGVIVRMADDEVVVDVGSRQGLPSDARLQVYRRLVVTHPLSGKQIIDRFPIGSVPLAERGELLSIVRDVKGLQRRPVPGDFVVYEPVAPVAKAAPAPAPEVKAVPALPPVAPADEVALEAVLRDNMGRPLPERIQSFEAYVKAFPRAKAIDAVGTELARLRSLLDNERALAEAAAKPAAPLGLTSRFDAPRLAVAGAPLDLTVAVVETEHVEAVRLFARPRGTKRYEALPMRRDGDYYWRGSLPEALTKTDAEVEYFVEAVRTDSALEPLQGSAAAPLRVRVEAAPTDPERRERRSRAAFSARSVDFDTGGAPDRYLQTEADFTYLLEAGLLRTFRVGVGLIDGEGGRTEALDAGADPRRLALGYGFAETEMGFNEVFGVAVRLIGGNHRATDDGTAARVFGGEGRLRFGTADGTRLVVGGSALQDLGNRAFTELHIEAIDGFPLKAGAAVTNLPVDADLGVQLSFEAGWRVTDLLTLTAQTGWNARTINHHGLTAGGGAVLDW